MRLACFPTDSYGEAYYAQDLGFFKQHGVNVEFVVNNAGAAALAALAGNSVDIGIANPLSIAHAAAKGLPISVFVGAGLYSPAASATLLVVPKTSPLQKAKDLEGRTIGVSGLGDLSQAGMFTWLQKNGADPAKVKFIEFNPPALILAALEQGRIDAGDAAGAGHIAVATKLRADLRRPAWSDWAKFFLGLWAARTDWLKANTDAARRFADAIYDAARWANAHHDESAAILAKYAKADPETFHNMRRATYSETALDPRLIQPILDAATKTGMLTPAIRASDMVPKGF